MLQKMAPEDGGLISYFLKVGQKPRKKLFAKISFSWAKMTKFSKLRKHSLDTFILGDFGQKYYFYSCSKILVPKAISQIYLNRFLSKNVYFYKH